MRTLISAEHLLVHEAGHHALLRDGQIVYEDDRIVFVGRGFTGSVDEALELGRSLVLPGLVDLDALTDIDHLILDSWASPERAAGLAWSEEWFRERRRDVFTLEERLAIREYALVQLALHGITTFMPIAAETHSAWAESFDELSGMAEISRRLGLRGYLGPAYRAGVNVVRADGRGDVLFDEELGRAGLADATRFLEHCAKLGDPLVTGVLLLCRIETLTPDLMRKTAELAAERDVLVRLHAAERYVEAATLGGAKALRRPDLGRLAVGAQADLVAFALDDIRDGVVDDPVRTLLLNGTARQVTHTVVAGRMVVRDGSIPGVDEAALRNRAQTLFERMRAGYPERDHAGRPERELFPPTFPPTATR